MVRLDVDFENAADSRQIRAAAVRGVEFGAILERLDFIARHGAQSLPHSLRKQGTDACRMLAELVYREGMSAPTGRPASVGHGPHQASPCGSTSGPNTKCRTRRRLEPEDFDEACSTNGRMSSASPRLAGTTTPAVRPAIAACAG